MALRTEIRLLGPVELRVGGEPVRLGGAKQRAVLAMLALAPNQSVSADRLMEGLWQDRLPTSAPKMVQHYIWQLRKALPESADAEIVTRGRSYELRIDEDGIDVRRFRRLLASATGGSANGERGEALELWRGEPLADLADEPFAAAEIRELEALRLEALEQLAEDDLVEGRMREALERIDQLVSSDPLRERAHALRMLALYRAGRQSEALDAFRCARETLLEELAVEPGSELRRLQAAILRQDPDLEPRRVTRSLPQQLVVRGVPPLSGRDAELAALMALWQRARAGRGAAVGMAGATGMGKTRLAAEIAAEAARHGASVLYASGADEPAEAEASAAAAATAERATLLVVDDLDRGGADVFTTVARVAAEAPDRPLLVLMTASDAAALPPADELLALLPLDAEAVRWVAAYYAIGDAAAKLPVEDLLARSRGVPSELLRLAAAWARDDAADRVNAAASELAHGGNGLRSAQAAVTASVLELQRASERARAASPEKRSDGVIACPYQGLAAFDVDDAERFFGRERLVAALVARLATAPLLALVGASGSGKSSLLRAGLLPALAAGVLPGSEAWQRRIVRPGRDPPAGLLRATDAVDGAALVVVDQFEEIFTACREEAQREAFVAELARLAADPGVRVVLAVRSDFYGHCARYPDLASLLADNQLLIGPMRRDELRRVIEGPAERVGLSVEPELSGILSAEVEGEPGGLPLLSTALAELWEHSDRRQLRLADYEDTEGVRGSVARMAEAAYTALPEQLRAVARAVLLRLADVDEGGAAVRRRASREEFDGAASDVVAALADRRLLTLDERWVELAHEALLREWPRLQQWLAEDAEHRRTRHRLADAARSWRAADCDDSELYRGARLAAAVEWSARHEDELSEDERAFLGASRSASERTTRRLRVLLAASVAALAAAIAAGVVAFGERAAARDEARVAEAQRLGAEALTGGPLDRSLLLARQGVELHDASATRGNLLAALLRSPAAVAVAEGDGHRMLTVDAAPDGRLFAAGDNHGHVLVFDASTGRRVGRYVVAEGAVFMVRFSPDGRLLAIPYGDHVDIVDAATLRRLRRLEGEKGTYIDRVAFSHDGGTLAADYAAMDRSGRPGPGLLLRWNVETGRRLGPPEPITEQGTALVGYTEAGTLVTSSEDDRMIVVRDADTLAPLRRFKGGTWAAAISRDGRRIALGGVNGSVRLVDQRTGAVRPLPAGHAAEVLEVRFSPDGRRLVSAGDDGRVLVWDVARGELLEALEGHAGRVRGVAVGAAGGLAYSAGLDGRLITWDLAGAQRLGRPFRAGPGNPNHPHPAISPDGAAFAVPDQRGVVRVFDSRTLRLRRQLTTTGHGAATGAAFGRRGGVLAATHADGTVAFWDTAAGRPLGKPVPAHDGPAFAPGFSADGRRLATAGEDGKVRLWDARHRVPVARADTAGTIADVALSPDGRMVVASTMTEGLQGRLETFAAPSMRRVRRRAVPAPRWGRFSTDGRVFLRGDDEGSVEVLDGQTLRRRLQIPRAHAGFVISADADPAESLLATASTDGTTRLWDLRTARPIGSSLPGVPNRWVAARFIAGGRHLVAVYDDGRAWRWDVRPNAWKAQACSVAGRQLTQEEWREVLPGRDFSPAC